MSPFGGEIHFLRENLVEKLFLMVFGSWHTGARIRAFHILRLASKYIKAGYDVLDAGCGLGRHAFFISRKYPSVSIVGVDLSGKNISICNGIRKRHYFKGIRFQKGDLSSLELERRFDVIICSDVLEYIEEDTRALENFQGLLKENGRLILHAPRLNPRRYLGFFERYFRCDPREKVAHAREGYTDSQLREKLRKSGLTIAGMRYTFGHFGSLSWELSKIVERFKPLFVLCFPLILFLGYLDSLKTNRVGNGILIEAQQSQTGLVRGINVVEKVPKILYLNPTAEVGGAERSLLDLLKHLDKGKFHPIVCFPSDGTLMRELRKMGIETKVIPFHREISTLSRENGNRSFRQLLLIPWHLMPTILEMASFVRSRDVGVIVTNGIKCHFIGSIVSLMTGKKLIWHVRDVIETEWLRWKLRSWGRFFPDKIITNSHAVGHIFPGNTRKETLYNGINLSYFRPGIDGGGIRSEYKIGKETTLIGTIGHFAPLKGYEELLDAMAEVLRDGLDVKLAIVGEAVYQNSHVYKRKILLKANSAGLKDKIIFTGFKENIPEILASFDIFVLPSRSEGFGRVNLEAMAMGKPVVSTNVGGIPEVVRDGVTGILVEPGNSKALSHAIMRLLNDPRLRESMGRKGRERVEQYFTLHAHVQRIEEIYGEILG